jgi:hypothetical protein
MGLSPGGGWGGGAFLMSLSKLAPICNTNQGKDVGHAALDIDIGTLCQLTMHYAHIYTQLVMHRGQSLDLVLRSRALTPDACS